MSKSSEAVKRWRKSTKERMAEAFGGICCVCKNTYQPELFDFHHLNPEEKEFQMGSIRASSISWARIVPELRKCVMVCSNCHRLIHYNYVVIPDDALRFNDNFEEYKSKKEYTKQCVICSDPIPEYQKTCSYKCAAKLSGKVDWDSIDLPKLKETMSNYKIAEMLDISEGAVRKRLKKIQNML
jgi:hypothetical protein